MGWLVCDFQAQQAQPKLTTPLHRDRHKLKQLKPFIHKLQTKQPKDQAG